MTNGIKSSKYGKAREVVINTRNPDNCAFCGRNAARELHPEDRELQKAGEAEAAGAIEAFFVRHTDEFKQLVQTYGDGRAESLLDQLREKFWSSTPAGSE
jgi:hypothetical protein